MNWLTQIGRFIEFSSPLGENVLILHNFSGFEALSTPFQLSLNLISHNTDIKPEALLNKAVSIKLQLPSLSEPRYFHGYISRFYATHLQEGIRHYFAEMRPWLWFLNYTSDCRIFQNKSVIDIIKIILQEHGFNHYDFSLLANTYQKRDYCVQYKETTLHFISRILQEEGIHYFFQHADHKHTLMLADKTSAFKHCLQAQVEFTNGSHKGHCITQWHRQYHFYPGKFSATDYNFENTSVSLKAEQQSVAKLAAAQKFEIFYYPGHYQTTTAGKNLIQQQFEAFEGQYNQVSGASNYLSFTSGGKFTLHNAPIESDNGDYILTSVAHFISDGSYLAASQSGQSYQNLFTCTSAKTPIKPLAKLSKPCIQGAQTAIVVGPAGEELYTDKYGRIKVQFHWDRKGAKNDQSSCWIRVAQGISGKNWGMQFMPRIGQEVIVQFLEGDPDRPIIIGSVYNADHLPPYALPSAQTRSGIKMQSTKNGENESNELYFEDKKGNEEIGLYAQKDFNCIVKNNNNLTILQGNQMTQIKAGSSSLQAAESIELKVGNNSVVINSTGVFINGETVDINN